jgi:1-acyl-sn-glycerol-3-phosphate acyltransferase
MRFFFRPLQLIYFIYAALLFLAGMLPVAIFALLVSPLGTVRGGNILYKAFNLWSDIWLLLIGIRHRNISVATDKYVQSQEYIYIANHISWLDAALVPKVFRKPVRPLGKAEMGRIPIFGFIYRQAVVTVDRSSPEARKASVFRLKAVLRKGISILVFPEGTFNETGEPLAPFYDGSFRIAIETGTPIRPVLLLDSYARMPYHRSFSLNPGRSRAIFLTAVPVEGLSPEDAPALRDKLRAIMTENLIEYNADWIKPGEHDT